MRGQALVRCGQLVSLVSPVPGPRIEGSDIGGNNHSGTDRCAHGDRNLVQNPDLLSRIDQSIQLPISLGILFTEN